jgi:hypothetical protein
MFVTALFFVGLLAGLWVGRVLFSRLEPTPTSRWVLPTSLIVGLCVGLGISLAACCGRWWFVAVSSVSGGYGGAMLNNRSYTSSQRWLVWALMVVGLLAGAFGPDVLSG